MTIETHSEPLRHTGPEKNTKGFTLTEIAIVLGIIGLILGAIWTAAAAVYQNQRVAHANTAILQIVQAVRGLYATANSDAGLTVDNLVCSKAVPSDLVVGVCGGPATMIDMWPAGVTTIVPSAASDGFAIEMSAVPQAACINLLMAIGGQNRDPGLYYLGTTVVAVAGIGSSAAATTAGPPLTGSPTPLTAAVPCVAGVSTVAFGFSLKS